MITPESSLGKSGWIDVGGMNLPSTIARIVKSSFVRWKSRVPVESS